MAPARPVNADPGDVGDGEVGVEGEGERRRFAAAVFGAQLNEFAADENFEAEGKACGHSALVVAPPDSSRTTRVAPSANFSNEVSDQSRVPRKTDA